MQVATNIQPGQTLENPVTGERFTFTDTAATTDGELLAFDFALKPGGAVPMPHVHPALAMEAMFAEVIALAQAGRMNARGMPRNLIDLAPLVALGRMRDRGVAVEVAA